MKAITYNKFGSIKSFKLSEVKKPEPKANEVLVKIHAASVNSWDWDMVIGRPYIYRLLFGLFKPKYPILGIDIAGVVEAVGSDVITLKVGDKVFGDISGSGFGAFAEYVCTREELLAKKMEEMSFEQAAALPHGGVLALQSVNFNGELKAGQKILINGAGGSTGPFAIQMAKQYDVEITCVDTPEKFELLKELGAHHVINYKKEDYTKSGIKYDLIIDLVAHKSVFAYKRALGPKGAFTIVGGSVRRILQIAFIGSLITKFSNKKLGILMHAPGRENLNKLVSLFETGVINPVIEKTYTLAETPEALQRIGDGKSKGKLIIKIS